MSLLVERLNKAYQRELSKALSLKSHDDVLKNITITEVRTTNDLSYTKVFYICPKNLRGSCQEALEKAKGFLRSDLAKNVSARKTPELIFQYDEALEYGNHINEILNNINEK